MLVVVTGTGTGVGKTHLTVALARAWGRPVLAYKPVESGVDGAMGEDERALGEASTFHVKRPPLQVRLRAGVSPHLAARMEGRRLDLAALAAEVARLRAASDVLVELPGGLFSPLTDDVLNADLLSLLAPDRTLLVAPDRLGVLHDVLSATEAAAARGLRLSGVVLNAPPAPDASTGQNGPELGRLCSTPLLAVVARAADATATRDPAVPALVLRLREAV
jgi:dethiobiotin synthetase